jgi:prophage tail gpP-like protein
MHIVYAEVYFHGRCACGAVALYRVGRDGFCKQHRPQAVTRLTKFTAQKEYWRASWEKRQRYLDAKTLQHESARHTGKFG